MNINETLKDGNSPLSMAILINFGIESLFRAGVDINFITKPVKYQNET